MNKIHKDADQEHLAAYIIHGVMSIAEYEGKNREQVASLAALRGGK